MNYNDMITARVIEDSKHYQTGTRATTLVISAPKFIDAEFEKHRAISSNSSGDRAIPFNKMCQRKPYLPFDVRLNQRGMQGFDNVSEQDLKLFHNDLQSIYDYTVSTLSSWETIHKQHLNRYLLGFSIQSKVITATDWDNFFLVRMPFNELNEYLRNKAMEWKQKYGGNPDGSAADPSMIDLARKIYRALQETCTSIPILLRDEWHLPFITDEERDTMNIVDLRNCSAARCARVSYNNHDNTSPVIEKDLKLADYLITNCHPTPFEHILKPFDRYLVDGNEFIEHGIESKNFEGITHIDINGNYYSGNIKDFVQYRKLLGM